MWFLWALRGGVFLLVSFFCILAWADEFVNFLVKQRNEPI